MVTQFARKSTALVAALALFAVTLWPAAASAQGPFNRAFTIPVVGTVTTATGPGTFNGTATITRFVNDNGTVTAVGVLTGIVTPATGAPSTLITTFAAPVVIQATCQILNLVLGPLHLNLLGLVVDLNQVVLDITGVTGPGNLLGNLLCGIAGLLDNPGGLARLLNQILGILG
jgi:hypothetical protein